MGCDKCKPQNLTLFFYFNPRTPCGVRLRGLKNSTDVTYNFNPRTPCGVRPGMRIHQLLSGTISIHAPRVGCDKLLYLRIFIKIYFNPRTPCGVRRRLIRYTHRNNSISIHAPRVGCDLAESAQPKTTIEISIHAPRVGCDCNNPT